MTLSILASPPGSHLTQNTNGSTTKSHKWFQLGNATWYGKHFAGKPTANGETFDPSALTCAHRTLPFGSWIKVTNLRNRKIAFLRVNDRGPYGGPTNIIDLSFAAAHKLGFDGRAPVKLEAVGPNDPELAQQLVNPAGAPMSIEKALSSRSAGAE